MGKQFLNFNVPTTQDERLRERAHVESFPFEQSSIYDRKRFVNTYTDSACPISEA